MIGQQPKSSKNLCFLVSLFLKKHSLLILKLLFFSSCGKNFCVFCLYKDNFTVIFFWKLHVLKLLVNYFSGTLMISMGYIIGNFTLDATEISD